MKKSILVLESGQTYVGQSFGADTERFGEVVFNTSMTGYQEILTDPSYKGQIIVMTEPHIGNIGTNDEDVESHQVYAEGFVIREISPLHSNWRSHQSLPDYLIANNIPGISGLDTRSLTKYIRDNGAMRGVLSTLDLNPKNLLEKVKNSPDMAGKDWVKSVTCKKTYQWDKSEWNWEKINSKNSEPSNNIKNNFHVVVMDFGVKQNILRCLADKGCKVTVVPAETNAQTILGLKPNGIMLSNGPGDPEAVTYAIDTIRELVELQETKKIAPLPVFGICLGHQLLGLALGGKTFKLKFGHRGANHPIKDLTTGKIEITTQNHGFCVDLDSLPDNRAELTHINLNDKTAEGLRHKTLPIFSVQYHPESSGGPHDSRYLFNRFIDFMKKYK